MLFGDVAVRSEGRGDTCSLFLVLRGSDRIRMRLVALALSLSHVILTRFQNVIVYTHHCQFHLGKIYILNRLRNLLCIKTKKSLKYFIALFHKYLDLHTEHNVKQLNLQ